MFMHKSEAGKPGVGDYNKNIFPKMCGNPQISASRNVYSYNTHTHTHTYIYIYTLGHHLSQSTYLFDKIKKCYVEERSRQQYDISVC